jgi:putative tricarboxylic transport membrane protein
MIGLMISFVGIEEIYGYQRFTFDNPLLINGISFIPAMIGISGIPQIIVTLRKKSNITRAVTQQMKLKLEIGSILFKNWWNILRSGLIGVGVGATPGAGEDIASWMAYDRAKKGSKKPEEFGKGPMKG